MSKIQRFDFGSLRDFRGPVVVKALREKVEEALPPPPPPPTFGESEMDAARLAARKQGFAEGFLAGEREAQQKFDSVTEQANHTIHALATQLASLEKQYQTLLQQESQQLSQLVMLIAQKVAGDAMNARGEQEILAMVERCLPVIFSKPKLSVELNPGTLDRAASRIEEKLRAAGYEGEVQFKPAPAFATSDVMLDWVSGHAKRSTADLWQEIETLIDRVPLEITFQETLSQANTTNP